MISASIAGLATPARHILIQSSFGAALPRCRPSFFSSVRWYAKAAQKPKRGIEKPSTTKASSPKPQSQSPKPSQPTVSPSKTNPSSSPAPKPIPKPSNRYAFPSRLLIYNSGTGKAAYIGVQRIAAVIFFVYVCGELAPGQWHEPSSLFQGFEWPPMVTKSVAALTMVVIGAAPLLTITILTSPFVNSIFLHVPAYSCLTRATLDAYASKLPRSALLDIVTIRSLGFPRTTAVRLEELRKIQRTKGLGLANLKRVEGAKKEGGGRWWMRFVEPRRKFYADPVKGEGRSRAPGVMSQLMKQIHVERKG